MVAETIITLYREETKTIIAEVYQGEQYHIPNDVKVFEGTTEQFLSEKPEYKYQNGDDNLLIYQEI
jgi:hypothetical protein